MFLQPVFDELAGRPFRWHLENLETGKIYEFPRIEMNRYIHWTTKTPAVRRDVFTILADSFAEFKTIKRSNIGFLTTHHTDFYEDGKYTEVLNDPVNYITDHPMLKTEAFLAAEQRIGNYRMGARRTITHLGGTISDDQLDDLSTGGDTDFHPITSISFPKLPISTSLI